MMQFPLAGQLGPLGSARGVAAGGPYLLDHFVDTDGTALASHAMNTGPGWTVVLTLGSWTIQSDRAEILGTVGSPCLAYSDAGHADGVMRCTLTNSDGLYNFLAFRIQDSGNFWIAIADRNSNALELFEYTGSYSLKASSPLTWNGSAQLMTVTLSGPNVQLDFNGATTNYGAATDFETATKWGLFALGNDGNTWADFSVAAA